MSGKKRASEVMGGRAAWKRIVVVVALGVITTFAVSVYCSYRGRMFLSKVWSLDRRATWWFTADEQGERWAESGVEEVAVTRNVITGVVLVVTAYKATGADHAEARKGLLGPGASVGDVSREQIALVCEPWEVAEVAPEHIERGPVSEVRPAPGAGVNVRRFTATGWPMYAFEMETLTVNGPTAPNGQPSGEMAHRGGVIVPAERIPFYAGPVWEFWEIPLRPRWGGLVVNSALAGAGWWLVLALPGVVRRWRRQRGGRCVSCGYSLAGLTSDACPECGKGHGKGRIAHGSTAE